MEGGMRQYQGAVCFLDLLGMGALTRNQIKLVASDYDAHLLSKSAIRTEQGFCANLLIKFRRVLLATVKEHPEIQIAQLSDSAFLWSPDILSLMKAVSLCMRLCVRDGLFCRGGVSFGDIIEPGKVNSRIGAFVLGEAVTNAVMAEGSGKGCRVFADLAFSRKALVHSRLFHTSPIFGLRNPLDGSITDEFRWYVLGDRNPRSDKEGEWRRLAAFDLLEMVSLLKYSPMFRWNVATSGGEVHVAASIEALSTCISAYAGSSDYAFGVTTLIGFLNSRRKGLAEQVLTKWRNEVHDLIQRRRFERKSVHHRPEHSHSS
jgi:hypothetical protein